MVQRRYDFDALRVFCTGSIFLFHCLCIFAVSDYYIANPERSVLLYSLVHLMLIWMLPVFFIISGRVTFPLLHRKNTSDILRYRFIRYMIPFMVGVLFLSPIIIYLSRVYNHEYSGSLLTFYINEYFHGLYGYGGNFSFLGHHLFYLLYLFIFTAIFLLILRLYPWRTIQGKLHDWLTVFQKPGAIFLLSIPIILTTEVNFIEPTVLGRAGAGGWNFFSHFLFFTYGLLFSFDHRFDDIIDRHWKISALLAIPPLAIYGFLLTDLPFYDALWSWPKSLLIGLAGFTTTLALFGIARRWMNKPIRRITILNKGVMPFYILHFPIVILFGYGVVQLQIGFIPKIVLVTVSSFLMTSVLSFVVARFRVLRLLFGLKVKWKRNTEEKI